MDYPYNQNASGEAYRYHNGVRGERVDHGYVRTIANPNKDIYGLVYHPYMKPKEHVRAQEIYNDHYW